MANPELWSGVPPRNPHFVGRQSELDQLHLRLREDHAALSSSLNGIGKTELAAEYVHRFAETYPGGVFWARAGRLGDLTSSLSALAPILGLPEADSIDQEKRREAVRAWFHTHPDWLFVVDDVRRASEMSIYLPYHAKERGRVLVIYPRRQGGLILPFKLDRLPDEDAERLLGGPLALAQLLDRHPLALTLARAFLDETGIAASDYQGLFERQAVPAKTPLWWPRRWPGDAPSPWMNPSSNSGA